MPRFRVFPEETIVYESIEIEAATLDEALDEAERRFLDGAIQLPPVESIIDRVWCDDGEVE